MCEAFIVVTLFQKGMALAVNVDKKPMLPLVSDAINGIFHNPKDPFWTGRVMDLLFDGIEIDCTSEEFAAKATCSIFESGEAKAVQPLRPNYYKFSLFGAVCKFLVNFSPVINVSIQLGERKRNWYVQSFSWY